MILVLIIGIVLGVTSVVFAMDNSTLVTVSLSTWHTDAPLALVIMASMVFGIFITLLSMVPSAIKAELERYALRREKQKLEARTLPLAVEGSQL